ncbi:MAG: hypothetical protein ABWK53_08915 [Anaerolineales bacterium]
MKLLLRDLRWILPVSLAVGALFALPDPGGDGWMGWLAFSLIFLLGGTALAALWRAAGTARTLGWILLIALLLRLGLGLAFRLILPAAGYDTETQNAGYLFFDAFHRDTQAWDLARSAQPLWRAFDKSYATDQYGGLLGLSALLYRCLTPDFHRPLLMVAAAALTATIGLALAWRAVAALADERQAAAVTWILALYPEALLQGSAQMREPFLLAFLAMVLWGLTGGRRAWPWLAGGMLGLLLFSPGVALFALFAFGGWTWLRAGGRLSWRGALIAAGVVVLGLALLWLGLSVGNLAGRSPLQVLTEWLRYSGAWEAYLAETRSGWLQRLFDEMPAGLRFPFLTAYGILQPVLPAALVEPAVWVWKTIGILRALGWYALLPFLLLAPLALWRQPQRRAWLFLWLAVWLWIALSAFRAGGDQWDNPRYRSIFLLPQAWLAVRAWFWQRESRSPWLGRLLTVEGLFLVLFLYWYIARYTGWTQGQVHFFVVAGAAAFLGLMVVIVGVIRDRRRA